MKSTILLLDAAANSLSRMGYTKLASELDSLTNHIEGVTKNIDGVDIEGSISNLRGALGLTSMATKSAAIANLPEKLGALAATLAAAAVLYASVGMMMDDAKWDAHQKARDSDLVKSFDVKGPHQTSRGDLIAEVASITRGYPMDINNSWNSLSEKENLSKHSIDSLLQAQFNMYGKTLFSGVDKSVVLSSIEHMSKDIKNRQPLITVFSDRAIDGIAAGFAETIIDGDLKSGRYMKRIDLPGYNSSVPMDDAVGTDSEEAKIAKEAFAAGISSYLKEMVKETRHG